MRFLKVLTTGLIFIKFSTGYVEARSGVNRLTSVSTYVHTHRHLHYHRHDTYDRTEWTQTGNATFRDDCCSSTISTNNV